jgi:hypothetical protein
VRYFDWWGILVKKVICVAPGHKKWRIFVFLSVAHLRFFFQRIIGQLKRFTNLQAYFFKKNIYIFKS